MCRCLGIQFWGVVQIESIMVLRSIINKTVAIETGYSENGGNISAVWTDCLLF